MNSLLFLVPLSQALNKSLFEEAFFLIFCFLFKKLLSCFFFFPKGQAFPALVTSWGLSHCPWMLAPEITAEAEKCEGVSLVPALEVNGKKSLAGDRRTGRAPSGLVSPRNLPKAGWRTSRQSGACVSVWFRAE